MSKSTNTLLLIFCTFALFSQAFSAHGSAKIWLVNNSNRPFFFQVLHQYTDHDIQSSNWVYVKPGEGTHILDVTYRYGFLTTGVDNWKINGHDASGRYWRAGYGYAADWKKHFLTSKDNDKWTHIKIYTDTVQFISESGNSETKWFVNEGRGNTEPWSQMFDTTQLITGIAKDITAIAKEVAMAAAAGGGK